MKDGKVHHEYNYFGLEHTNVASTSALAPGQAHDRLRVHPR